MDARPGPSNAITDVPGLRVGHATRIGDGAQTGTTVLLAPPGGVTAAVDVRGSGPCTRETDALDPRNVVDRVEALVLTGGSAYGLDAASGVVGWLAEQHRGFRVGPDPGHVVPVVPTLALFDLGRGGDFTARPDAALGRAAIEAAAASAEHAPVAQGAVGAGTGAIAGGLKGGIGTASAVLPGGVTVGALVAVNALGAPMDPRTGALYGAFAELGDEFGGLTAPDAAEHARASERMEQVRAHVGRIRPLNTTIGIVATSAPLDRAQAQKLAGVAHDGMARALRPLHTLSDGDAVFAVATGTSGLPAVAAAVAPEHVANTAITEIHSAAADVFTRAIVHAILAAEPLSNEWGQVPSYRALYPRATAGR